MTRSQILWLARRLDFDNVLPHARNVQCSCPLARWEHPKGSDSKPSMGIMINEAGPSLVNCFACGFRGTAEMLVQRLQRHRDEEDLSDAMMKVAEWDEEALEAVLGEAGEYEEVVPEMAEVALPEVYLDDFRGLAHPYVLRRGFDIDPTLKTWEVGYDAEQKRVVLPVRNRNQELVGAVGRGVSKHSRPKYLNYWKFEKGLYLFGEHLLPDERGSIVVVEGPLDALRVWQETRRSGVPANVVALMGADPTWKQIEKLAKWADDVVLFLDNDAPGWKAVSTIHKALKDRVMVTAVEYPSSVGGDPAEDAEGNPWPEGWHADRLENVGLLL